ncbi:hypothetical protein ASG42_25290 [Rhizobium sp. Leaf391]|uniref:response regulator n=1 Tax=Rhizobium sp. Leaf391 TaxID=1736360 RepID=UPI0007150A8C|nr:response regulator [Rhizobium sp. Leaf391]KQT02814.1 hypothetical protein ASG42_25290 [Rhizobium sp. Leaf391]
MSLHDFDDPSVTCIPAVTTSVLVVEDEPFIAMDIQDILSTAGLSPEVRSSRADVLNWLNDKSPAAAILDLQLRDGDGLAVAQVLAARDVPVVICSGAHPEDFPADIEAVAWIRKPFAEADLVAAVRQAVEMRQFHREMEERA